MRNTPTVVCRRPFSICLKILAFLLSLLMVFYAVPVIVYAEIVETVDTSLPDGEDESCPVEALTLGESMDVVFYGYTYNDSGAETLSEFNAWGVGGATVDYTYDYDKLYRPTYRQMFTDGGYYQDWEYRYRDQNTTTTTGQISQSISYLGSETGDLYVETTYTYEYDTNGNITQITDSAGNITKYTYDDLGQLTREDNPYLNKSYTYTYDTAGNRTSKKTYAYTTSTLGTVTDTQTLTYKTDSTWGDQLANNTYDAVGNPLTYNGNTMTWNGRQLMRIYGYAGMVDYSFTYNDEGIRTSKNINGTVYNYTLDGSTILSQQWGNHLMVFLYDESGSPIGLQYRSTSYAEGVFDTYYYEKNVFGDIIGIYTEDGTYIGGYTYDAWGTVKTKEVTSATTLQRQIVRQYNPFRYRGYYYDTHSSLYYLQSRYYDPSTGRFINADGYINGNGDLLGYNMYAYCSNNPVMYYDPSGDIAITTLILIGAAVVGVSVAGYTAYTEYQAGSSTEEIIVNSAVNGITAFCTVYSLGMTAYQFYEQMCCWYGSVPITNIGSSAVSNSGSSTVFNSTVHGNSIHSTKPQHGYEIFNKKTGDVVKTGISGQPLNMNGTSPRANVQVNALNRSAGENIYEARVVITGIPNRAEALAWERQNTTRLWDLGNSLSHHRRPKP